MIFDTTCKLFSTILDDTERNKGGQRIVGIDVQNDKEILNFYIDKEIEFFDLDYDELNNIIYLSAELKTPSEESEYGMLYDMVIQYNITSNKTEYFEVGRDINDGKEGTLEALTVLPSENKVYVNSCYYQGGSKSVKILNTKDKISYIKSICIPDSPLGICKNDVQKEIYVLGEIDGSDRQLGLYVIDGQTDKESNPIPIQISNDGNKVTFNQRNILAVNNELRIAYVLIDSTIYEIDIASRICKVKFEGKNLKLINYNQAEETFYAVQKEKDGSFNLIKLKDNMSKQFELPKYVEDIKYIAVCSRSNVIALNISTITRKGLNTNSVIFFNTNIFKKNVG